jgi:hypothetical protein
MYCTTTQPAFVIIDRRTMLTVHQMPKTNSYVVRDIKWHGHNLILAKGSGIELYDLRRVDISTSSSSSMIWFP